MLAALRSQVNLTTVLTLAFVAYMSASLRNLYRVAVPAIPSVLAPDGSHKPTLESLWLRSPGITFNISLGTSQHPKQSGDLLVLHRHGVPFNWKLGFEVDLQLDIEQESKDSTTLVGRCAAADLTPACSAAASDWTARHPKIDADAAAADGATSLVVGRWTGPDAAHIVRALRRGKPVYLHAVVAWDNIRDGPGGEFAALRGTSATTNLVESVRYVPPRALRYLWRDPWGDLLRAELAAADNSTSGFRIPAAKGGGSILPVPEEPWPHWVGQADIGLIMDTQPFPREEIPQQIDGYLRKDIARTVYAPLMAVNAVRPTRERYHPLNVSFPSLPLRLRVVPMPIGQWQLMRMLDASITTQKSIGASDKDTDDVIRLLAETPLWLLGITFVVSFIHILFDALAIKNDVSFWAAAKTLRGISVRSLSISFVSNVVITLYLWEEGSSMLVLIPQAGNTVLLLWKIAKASGFVCATRYRVVPWLVYDAALHASATAGMTSAADSEAMHFLLLMIGPWVCGFAVYALLYQSECCYGVCVCVCKWLRRCDF